MRILARTALVLALSFLAAEATVRFAAGRIPGVRTLAQPTGTRVRDPESFAEFQHAYRDHLVSYREMYGFRCNSLGFHDLEFQRAMPPGGMRIVALGDSFAFGTVPYGHLYLTLAEALLLLARTRDAVAAPLAIDNLGVPASGIADYRLVYALVGRELAPDLVLVTLYLGNDPRDYADAARFGGTRRWPDSWLVTFLRRAARLALERARRPSEPGAAAPEAVSGLLTPRRRCRCWSGRARRSSGRTGPRSRRRWRTWCARSGAMHRSRSSSRRRGCRCTPRSWKPPRRAPACRRPSSTPTCRAAGSRGGRLASGSR